MPLYDYGQQSQAHLQMILQSALNIFGLPAQVFSPETFANGYAEVYPEFTEGNEPTGTCKILLGQPTSGLQLSDFISLSDKVQTTMIVTTNYQLSPNQQLVVTFPDGKTLNLRIMSALTSHALSTVWFRFEAIVT